MLHELAHASDAETAPDFTGPLDRARLEQTAESAAYLVGTSLGIDIEAASSFYLANWGANTETVAQMATHVLRVAGRLETLVARGLSGDAGQASSWSV